MRAHPPAIEKNARRLRIRTLWICLLASLFAISMAARPELRGVLAQSSSPQAASQKESGSPAQDSGAQAQPHETPVQQETLAPLPTDPRQKKIADDSENLLKLTNRLKAEVDQTTVDTLSITAVRDVQEIEKLAHKMRGK